MKVKIVRKVKKVAYSNAQKQEYSTNNNTTKTIYGDLPTFRLCYVEMREGVIGRGFPTLQTTYCVSSPFISPPRMTNEQIYQVISYLMDNVKKANKFKFASIECVKKVSSILRDYGFYQKKSKTFETYTKKSNFSLLKKMTTGFDFEKNVNDMFVVNGNVRLFEQTDLNNRFFQWYTPTTHEQIKNIYKDIGKENVFNKAECKHTKNSTKIKQNHYNDNVK